MRLVDRDLLRRMADLGSGLDRRTTPGLIADKLLTLIATGVIAPGDELPSERALADMLSVSRETVRGAIKLLSARGAVEVSQGSRTRVTDAALVDVPIALAARDAVDRYDLASVHQARLLVELAVVGDAADRIGPDEIAALERSLNAQLLARRDVVRFLICDREFHTIIYRACGNPLLADVVTDLYIYAMEHRRRAMARPGAIAASWADHAAIVVALKGHDRRAVVEAFRKHLERIRDTTEEELDTLSWTFPPRPEG